MRSMAFADSLAWPEKTPLDEPGLRSPGTTKTEDSERNIAIYFIKAR